ncbi:MAG: hypothetical protein J6K61_07045 [Clostridia bacterium]|nr:hypothetical protein [Clostridia bacterium]
MKSSSFKQSVWQFCLKASALCVLLTLLFFASFALINAGTLNSSAMPFKSFAFILLFSAVLVGSMSLFKLNLPFGICILLHYFAFILSLFLLFWAVGMLKWSNTGGTVSFFVFFTLLYALVAGVTCLLRSRLTSKKAKSKKEEPKYEKQF